MKTQSLDNAKTSATTVASFTLKEAVENLQRQQETLGRKWQAFYAGKVDHGHGYEQPGLSQAYSDHLRALTSVAHAVKAMPQDPSLNGYLKTFGARVALGARGATKAALGLVGGTVWLAAVVGTLGIAAYSSRVNARVKFVLAHGCLHGAKADLTRMVASDVDATWAKYNHIASGVQQKAMLKGYYGPIFSGVRSAG